MINRIALVGSRAAVLILTAFLSMSATADFETISGAQPDATARWSASGGKTALRFDPDLLRELDISVYGPATAPGSDLPGQLEFVIRDDAALDIWTPWAAFDGFAAGELRHSGGFSIEWPGGRLDSDGFVIRPASSEELELVDSAGNILFRLDHIHAMLYPDEHRVTLENMGMSLSPWLARHMGYPDLVGFGIGAVFTHSTLDIPVGAQTEGTCSNPNWHNGTTFLTDVELTNLSEVQEQAREPGVRVAIAPSATLENVGTADVPWYEKFATPEGGTYPEPYDRDQHPFLVWAMYRIVDDIPQQIGQSAVKHAFFTVNSSCSCSGGNILWSADSSPNGLGCRDTYDDDTNDNPLHLGPREEVPAFTGLWEQCGSIFAPEAEPPGPCTKTFNGSTMDPYERRLVVEEDELTTANATYYFESWYVIRDDVNIFGMVQGNELVGANIAHRSVEPMLDSTWTFPFADPPAGSHTPGGAIDSWVSPNQGEQGPDESHVREATGNGHYSVAVKVSDLGGGNYRYVYALMNYDFDPRFDSFALALPEGVVPTNIQFLDGDSNGANDWTSSTAGGKLTWSAPAGAELEWGFMATFVFEANQAPVPSKVDLTAFEEPLEFSTSALGLVSAEDVFQHGFEDN